LSSGAGVDLGSPAGIVTVVDGIATFLPVIHKDSAAQVTIKPVAEIAPGLLDIGVTLSLLAMPDLPPVEMAYAGPPHALAPSEDTAALVSHLGFRILQQGVKELERLQREQQRILEEEERSRREDEERLQDYYAQKYELRLRQQELQVHARQRVIEEERRAEAERQALDFYKEANRQELPRRSREMSVHARQRALDEAARAEAERRLKEDDERDGQQATDDHSTAALDPGPTLELDPPPLPRTKPQQSPRTKPNSPAPPARETTADEPVNLLKWLFPNR
jgi:hypothetical protein